MKTKRFENLIATEKIKEEAIPRSLKRPRLWAADRW